MVRVKWSKHPAVRQYQKTRHMTLAGKITNCSVISESSRPRAEGASWKNAAPEACYWIKMWLFNDFRFYRFQPFLTYNLLRLLGQQDSLKAWDKNGYVDMGWGRYSRERTMWPWSHREMHRPILLLTRNSRPVLTTLCTTSDLCVVNTRILHLLSTPDLV